MQRCVAIHFFILLIAISSFCREHDSWNHELDGILLYRVISHFDFLCRAAFCILWWFSISLQCHRMRTWFGFFFRSEHMTLAPIVESIGSVEASSSEHMLFAVDTLRTDCIEFLLVRCAAGSFVIEKRIRIALPLLCEHRLEANTLWEEERYSSKNNRSY